MHISELYIFTFGLTYSLLPMTNFSPFIIVFFTFKVELARRVP